MTIDVMAFNAYLWKNEFSVYFVMIKILNPPPLSKNPGSTPLYIAPYAEYVPMMNKIVKKKKIATRYEIITRYEFIQLSLILVLVLQN